MAKSDKMYSKSPKLERNEKGDVGIKKPTQADGENMGVSGDDEQGNPASMPIHPEQVDEMQKRHMKEMKDTHARHEGEIKDMHKRHHKEVGKLTGEKDKE